MAPDPTQPITLPEVARAFTGISPFLPPAMQEVVAQALQAALQFSGERDSLQVHLTALREQIANNQSALEASGQRLQSHLQSEREVQTRIQRELERERQARESADFHVAKRDRLDKARVALLGYLEDLR